MTPALPAPAAIPANLCHGIAPDAARQLDAMAARGIHAISFTPSGGWVIVGRPGERQVGYAARGIPDACFVKLGEFVRAGHAIRCVAFPPAGGWLVVSDQAYFASGIPDDCFGALVDAWAAGLRPSCVAFAPGGGWALLAGAHVAGEGVPHACWQQLSNWRQRLRPARQLAFAPEGGWVLLSADRVAHEGIDAACAAHLAQVGQAHQVERVAFAPGGAWAVGSETLREDGPEDPLCAFEEHFRFVNGRWRTLRERMAALRCDGAGLAVATAGEWHAATQQGVLDAMAWRSEVDAWMLGAAMEPSTPGTRARVLHGGRIRALALACGTGAAALADEMIEAVARLWLAEPGTPVDATPSPSRELP